MATTRGRQVVIPLTNKSGGSVAAGDVVVVDTSNDTAFTTTTTARSEVSLGVAQETIANNATGRVLTHGYAALVNVPASVTRGHYIETHTVAKQATGSSSRRSGSFGQFLTGGTTPTGWLWGSTDQTGSGTSLTGMIPIVLAPGFLLSPSSTDNTASRGLAFPVMIPGTMRLRAAVFRVTVTGAGTHEWGLFDYSSDATACTKLAGGSGALSSTGWIDIAASGAPVTINPGNYMMIFKWPAATAATISTASSGVANKVVKFIAGYTWDDTPDLTTSWADHTALPIVYLRGDLNASSTW